MKTRNKFVWILACAIGFILTSSTAVWAQCADKLTAGDGAERDGFGCSVSISGETLVVGAVGDDDAGSRSGAAYVFRWNGAGWKEQAKLTASDAWWEDFFGHSVSISGNIIVVGAHGNAGTGLHSGAAYVFRWNGTGWEEQAKLTNSDAALGDSFGCSVSISGEALVVGAPGDDDGSGSGSAYVFRWNGTRWEEEAKLTASDAGASDSFGESVSISGDFIAVGAFSDEDAGPDSGSAYVYRQEETGWEEKAKLTASDAGALDSFGESVSISGDTIVVGAYGGDDNGFASGSAYVFRRNGTAWAEEAKLTASDGAERDSFGWSVSISGDFIVVGAHLDDNASPNSGSAYVYRREETGWEETAKLTAGDAAWGDSLGWSVSISGDSIAVGAVYDDDAGFNSGSTYGFSVFPYGDLTGDGEVALSDIMCVLDAFGGNHQCLENADIAGAGGTCGPDGIIDLGDILAVLDAFQGISPCCL